MHQRHHRRHANKKNNNNNNNNNDKILFNFPNICVPVLLSCSSDDLGSIFLLSGSHTCRSPQHWWHRCGGPGRVIGRHPSVIIRAKDCRIYGCTVLIYIYIDVLRRFIDILAVYTFTQYLHAWCQDFRYEVYGLGLVSLLSVKNSEDVVGRVLLFKACSWRDLASWIAATSHWYRDHGWWYTLLGTNISPTKTLLKIIFLWDTLVPWKGFHYWKPVSLHDVQL